MIRRRFVPRLTDRRPVAERLEPRALLSADVRVQFFHDADGDGTRGAGEGPYAGIGPAGSAAGHDAR